MRVFAFTLIAATVGLGACGGRPDDALRVATGAVSHFLCQGTFGSGEAPEQVYADTFRPIGAMALLDWGLSHEVDRSAREVRTTFIGGFQSRSAFVEGSGCRMLHGAAVPAEGPLHDRAGSGPSLLGEIAGPGIVEPADPRLRAALDRAFAEPAEPPFRRTKAVVVVHDGRVIAERYATGYGIDTPILGNSLTKSAVNALAGILVRQGRLDMMAPAPVAAWADKADPRHAITPDDLLRMRSGLDLGDSTTAGLASLWSPSNRMLFLESDMAAYAANQPLLSPPGTSWTYADASTLLLSRVLADRMGGTAADFRAFAQRELWGPLGMDNVLFGVDAAGTPVGAVSMLAPARAWARLGLLYLNDGMAGSERLLPPGWVDYSKAPTPGARIGYGAGFWTNKGDSFGARNRIGLGMPADAFFGRGMFGQFMIVVPSARLVIVRLGVTHGSQEIEGVSALVAEVIQALPGAAGKAEGRIAAWP